MFSIIENEVHVWYLNIDLNLDPTLEASYTSLLAPEEQSVYEKLTLRSKKLEYLLTRTLVRQTLSRYTSILPTEWRFGANEFGRPHIVSPNLGFPLQFNLSHTQGLITCAVGLNCELGIDIEYTENHKDLINIAEDNFAKIEFQSMAALSPTLQVERFYQYWTLKEAYLKAIEVGLSLSTKKFSFAFESTEQISLSIAPDLDAASKNWQFKLLRPKTSFQLAIAYRSLQKTPVKIVENWRPVCP